MSRPGSQASGPDVRPRLSTEKISGGALSYSAFTHFGAMPLTLSTKTGFPFLAVLTNARPADL